MAMCLFYVCHNYKISFPLSKRVRERRRRCFLISLAKYTNSKKKMSPRTLSAVSLKEGLKSIRYPTRDIEWK